MRTRKSSFTKILGLAVTIGALFGISGAAQAGIAGATYIPTITAGAPPDTPAAHVDPNVSSSKYSGVVSIQIQFGDEYFICSGALVGKRQVVSAGHCVDKNGDGKVIDLKDPNNSVYVAFNSNGDYGTFPNSVIQASAVSINPNYQGFNNCPDGSKGCVNDDLSVITLSKDAPASAKIYKIATTPLSAGSHIIMAGYGTSGDGVNGHTIDPVFDVKRIGENVTDYFESDDELNFEGGKNEVYYADFDGGGKNSFCTYFGICTVSLPNGVEAGIGGGDSGGPSFIELYGELMVVANNTFETPFLESKPGVFGTLFGGIILGAYVDYLNEATGGQATFVPEPGSLALLALGGAMLGGLRRRRKQ